MRVVLDAFWWVRGTQSLKHVVHGLTETWSEEHPEDEITIVVRRKHLASVTDLPDNVTVIASRLWPQALIAAIAVPLNARRLKADGMISHNFAPLFGRGRGVYIQDVMFSTNPEWFSRKELAYYRWMTRFAGRSEIVFASTDTEGRRIAQHTGAKRIVTAGIGLSPDLTEGEHTEPLPGLQHSSFLLAVGRLNVRKNLLNTLEGARHSGLLSPDFPVVIVGERDGAWDALPDWVHAAEASGEVVFTGFVSLPQLKWLIRSCRLYVCLSLDEGFGLPPVEARVLGAEVLVSDRPVFHEALDGTHATFVEPTSPSDIGLAMRRLVGSTTPSGSASDATRLIERHHWRNVVAVMRREIAQLGRRGR